MSDTLLPCESCHRHLRAGSSLCPFCDAPVRHGATMAALCLGAALAASLAAPAEALAQSPRILLAQAPASAYGAPPDFDPLLPGSIHDRRRGAIVSPPTVTVQVRELELRGAVDPTAARRALSAAYPTLRRCADLARREGVSAIRARVEVSPQGRVTVREVEGASPRLRACVTPRAATDDPRTPPGRRVGHDLSAGGRGRAALGSRVPGAQPRGFVGSRDAARGWCVTPGPRVARRAARARPTAGPAPRTAAVACVARRTSRARARARCPSPSDGARQGCSTHPPVTSPDHLARRAS
jgi:hypothetical protein